MCIGKPVFLALASFFPVTDDLPCAHASAILGCLSHMNLRCASDLNGILLSGLSAFQFVILSHSPAS